ncbi:MAG TPA: hypothetical protein DDX92_02585 [Flavobacteriales bacterium]|jgi:hypothetical protein|nr:hypothetical protein [Flavobacteriales bacterium]
MSAVKSKLWCPDRVKIFKDLIEKGMELENRNLPFGVYLRPALFNNGQLIAYGTDKIRFFEEHNIHRSN